MFTRNGDALARIERSGYATETSSFLVFDKPGTTVTKPQAVKLRTMQLWWELLIPVSPSSS